MSNTDCEKAKKAAFIENLTDVLQTAIISLSKKGYSADEIQEWLQTNLNKADDRDDEWRWKVDIIRPN